MANWIHRDKEQLIGQAVVPSFLEKPTNIGGQLPGNCTDMQCKALVYMTCMTDGDHSYMLFLPQEKF